jgi:hypothetical protein
MWTGRLDLARERCLALLRHTRRALARGLAWLRHQLRIAPGLARERVQGRARASRWLRDPASIACNSVSCSPRCTRRGRTKSRSSAAMRRRWLVPARTTARCAASVPVQKVARRSRGLVPPISRAGPPRRRLVLEVRTATSLARLWTRARAAHEALELLRSILDPADRGLCHGRRAGSEALHDALARAVALPHPGTFLRLAASANRTTTK